ncbi:unnamed protein product [Sympodiomycopsis kandeliae]
MASSSRLQNFLLKINHGTTPGHERLIEESSILPRSIFLTRLFNIYRIKKLAAQANGRLNPDVGYWELYVAANRHKKKLEAQNPNLQPQRKGKKAQGNKVKAPTFWFTEEDFEMQSFEVSDDVKEFFGQRLNGPQQQADESAQQARDKEAYKQVFESKKEKDEDADKDKDKDKERGSKKGSKREAQDEVEGEGEFKRKGKQRKYDSEDDDEVEEDEETEELHKLFSSYAATRHDRHTVAHLTNGLQIATWLENVVIGVDDEADLSLDVRIVRANFELVFGRPLTSSPKDLSGAEISGGQEAYTLAQNEFSGLKS